jgi:RimJ/RimL family protein N-acetyltransferase
MERLPWTYRPITLEDVPDLLDWYNDRELHEIANSREFHPYTLDELHQYWKKKLNREHARYFAILVNGRLIGRVGLKKSQPSNDLVEYSILIGDPGLYSRGLGTEITRQMISEAFSDPGVQTVRLFVRQDNKRAIRCYEKSGYRHVHSFTQNGVPMEMMQVERKDWT